MEFFGCQKTLCFALIWMFFSGFLRGAHNLVGPSQSNISMLLKAQAAMLCSSYPFHREDRQARKVLFDGKTVLIGLKRGLKNKGKTLVFRRHYLIPRLALKETILMHSLFIASNECYYAFLSPGGKVKQNQMLPIPLRNLVKPIDCPLMKRLSPLHCADDYPD